MTSLSRRKILSLLVACTLVQGCAHGFAGFLESPEVFLVGIRPLPSENLEQRFEVDLRILNPNDRELVVDGVDFTLFVGGTRLSRGVGGDEVVLPRFGEAVVTLQATTTVFDLFRQLLRVPEAEAIDYELVGRVELAGWAGSLHFERLGSFDAAAPGPPVD